MRLPILKTLLSSTAPVDLDLVVEVSRSRSDTIHAKGLLWTSERPVAVTLTGNTQQLKETNFHDAGGIQTCSPRKRVAADTHLRPRGHWVRHIKIYSEVKARTQSKSSKLNHVFKILRHMCAIRRVRGGNGCFQRSFP